MQNSFPSFYLVTLPNPRGRAVLRSSSTHTHSFLPLNHSPKSAWFSSCCRLLLKANRDLSGEAQSRTLTSFHICCLKLFLHTLAPPASKGLTSTRSCTGREPLGPPRTCGLQARACWRGHRTAAPSHKIHPQFRHPVLITL